MSDYSRQNDGATHWAARDARSTGDADKRVVGAHFDTEFNAILTAVNSKYDSADLANTAAAQAQTATDKLLAPKSLEEWSDAGAGMVGDIWDLSDPGADRLLGWDDSAGAVVGFTMGGGITVTGTTISVESNDPFGLGDPNADRILFWDDSAGDTTYLTPGNGLEISTTNLQITDSAVSSSNPVGFTNGAPVFDMSSLTTMEGSGLDPTDTFLVENGGAPMEIAVQDMGFRIKTAQGTQNLAADDMNSIMKFNGTATLTMQINATTDLPLGVPVVLIMDHATQVLTVTADTSVTLESVFHPGGDSAASDVVRAGGMAVLVQTETDVWQISGDIVTA